MNQSFTYYFTCHQRRYLKSRFTEPMVTQAPLLTKVMVERREEAYLADGQPGRSR